MKSIKNKWSQYSVRWHFCRATAANRDTNCQNQRSPSWSRRDFKFLKNGAFSRYLFHIVLCLNEKFYIVLRYHALKSIPHKMFHCSITPPLGIASAVMNNFNIYMCITHKKKHMYSEAVLSVLVCSASELKKGGRENNKTSRRIMLSAQSHNER